MCIEEASQVFILGLRQSSPSCCIMGSSLANNARLSFLSHSLLSLRDFIFFQLQVDEAQKYYFLVTN